jgi:hypothetical protein
LTNFNEALFETYPSTAMVWVLLGTFLIYKFLAGWYLNIGDRLSADVLFYRNQSSAYLFGLEPVAFLGMAVCVHYGNTASMHWFLFKDVSLKPIMENPMTDEEVGELWAETLRPEHTFYGIVGCELIQALIRKLVKERELRYEENSHETRLVGPYEERALRGFGIDPATFKQPT